MTRDFFIHRICFCLKYFLMAYKAACGATLFFLVCSQPPVYSQSGTGFLNTDILNRGSVNLDAWEIGGQILDYQFSRADRELSPEKWMEEARKGIVSTRTLLADLVPDFFHDTESLEEFIDRSEEELENRFARWLLERFFGEGIEVPAGIVLHETGEAGKYLIYRINDDGGILYDSRTGDPVVIRPGDDDFDFSGDLLAWRNQTGNTVEKEAAVYTESVMENYPELFAYVLPGRENEFRKKIEEAGNSAVLSLRREFEAIIDREERYFTSLRLGDAWSSRKKNEEASADVLGEKLIGEARQICDDGIAAISEKIEAAKVDGGDLILAGNNWLEEYRRQFERGIKTWEAAEERFLLRRVEWEQSAEKKFYGGMETWAAVLLRFDEERERWEEQIRQLILEGERFFSQASELLETNIAEAKAEFGRDGALRLGAASERTKALASMYALSCSASEEARTNINFWIKKYNALLPDIIVPSEYGHFDSWLNAREMGLEEDDNEERLILGEIKSWLELSRAYDLKISGTLSLLEKELYLFTGGGENYLSEAAYNPEALEIERSRAKNELEYWTQRVTLSEAVVAYAQSLDAGRVTAAESAGVWEKAMSAYKEAAAVYEKAERDLAAGGTDVANARGAIETAANKMREAENALDELRQRYENLEIAMGKGGFENSIWEIEELRRKLQSERELLGRSDADSPWGKLLNSERDIKNRQYDEERKSVLTRLIAGDGDSTKPLASLAAKDDAALALRLSAISLVTEKNSLIDWYLLNRKSRREVSNFDVVGIGEQISLDKQRDLIDYFLKNLQLNAELNGASSPREREEIRKRNESIIKDYLFRKDYSSGLGDVYQEFGALSGAFIVESRKSGLRQFDHLWKTLDIETNGLAVPEAETLINAMKAFGDNPGDRFTELFVTTDDVFYSFSSWLEPVYDSWKKSFLDYCVSPSREAIFQAKRLTGILNANFMKMTEPETGKTNDYFTESAQYLENPKKRWIKTSSFEARSVSYNELNANKDQLQKHLSEEKYFQNEINRLEEILDKTEYGLIKRELEETSKLIKNAQKNCETQYNAYLQAADNFRLAGLAYDALYESGELAFVNLENSRRDLNIQDAIRLWSETAYLDIQNPVEELRLCIEKRERARGGLSVIEVLEAAENYSSEYAKTLARYRDSFSLVTISSETARRLGEVIEAEEVINSAAYDSYQERLSVFGKSFSMEASYVSPDDKSLWKIEDMITIKDGVLAFALDRDKIISGSDAKRSAALNKYFTGNIISPGDANPVSAFEIALRQLSERLRANVTGVEAYRNLGLARDYRVREILANNPGIGGTGGWYKIAGELRSGNNLGSMVVPYARSDKPVHKILAEHISNIENMQLNAWNSLSEDMKRDLEFYTILTFLGGGGVNHEYFSRMNQAQELWFVSMEADALCRMWDKHNDFFSLSYVIGADSNLRIAKNTRNSVNVSLNEVNNYINQGYNGFMDSLNDFETSLGLYKASSEKLAVLKGTGKKNVSWEDIVKALDCAGGMKGDSSALRSLWSNIRQSNSLTNYDIPKTLELMTDLSFRKKDDARRELEQSWQNLENQRLQSERVYRNSYEMYLWGYSDRAELANYALPAFGGNAPSKRRHLENMGLVLLENLKEFAALDLGGSSGYARLVGEYTNLVNKAMEDSFAAQLAVRENQWESERRDILEKIVQWKKSAAVILERGRMAWKEGDEKIRKACDDWMNSFRGEHQRVSGQWTAAFLEGLDNKENWASSVLAAANNASSDALVALVGAGAEAGARAMDTRDPSGFLNIADASEGERLLDNLLEKTGSNSLSSIFGSLLNSRETMASVVRAGYAGGNVWNSGLAAAEASALAYSIREEFEIRESSKMAYNVMDTARNAYRQLEANLERANRDVKKNMDETFIVGGQWRRSRDGYVKSVLVHSTLIDPVITESADVDGYRFFEMPAVNLPGRVYGELSRNMSAIQSKLLVDSVYSEIARVSGVIFGSGESGDGNKSAFDNHLGTAPKIRDKPDAEDGRAGVFDNYGDGELGRLLTEFYFWMVKEQTGIALTAQALWDKPIWDSRDSCIEAPTIRSAVDIAIQTGLLVSGVLSGGATIPMMGVMSALLNSADDMVFSMMDISGGYKSWEEAGVGFGKQFVLNAASIAAGSLFPGGGASGFLANNAAGNLAYKTLNTGLYTMTTGTVSTLVNSVDYNTENGFGFSAEAFKSGLKSGAVNVLPAVTGTFTSGLLDLGLTGFRRDVYANGHTLSGFAGGLASQGVNYATGNDFTLNLFNAGIWSKNNVNAGLVELRLGGDGAVFSLGGGGADVSAGTLTGALKGLEAWKVNAELFSSSREVAGKYTSQLRTLYSTPGIERDEYRNALSGKTEYRENYAVQETISAFDAETGVKTVYFGSDALNDVSALGLNVYFVHEAYRDGKIGTDAEQKNETAMAVFNHSRAASEFAGIYGDKSLGAKMLAEAVEYEKALNTGNADIFNSIIKNYDSGADYWKLVKNDDDYWEWIDDKSADFDISDLLAEEKIKNSMDRNTIALLSELFKSHNIDGKEYGIISAGRMTEAFANTLTYAMASNDLLPRIPVKIFSNSDPVPLYTLFSYRTVEKIKYNREHTTTVYDKLGRPTTFHNVDTSNNVRSILLGQHSDPVGNIPYMSKSGCVFMDTITVAQLLTKQRLSSQQVTEIWNQAIREKLMDWEGFVTNRDVLANIALKKLNISNFGITFSKVPVGKATLVGYRVDIPYRKNETHKVLTGVDKKLVYNPGNTFTSDQSKWGEQLGVYIYAK